MSFLYPSSLRRLAGLFCFIILMLNGIKGRGQDTPLVRRCAAEEVQQIRMDADPDYKAFVLRAKQAPTNKVNVTRVIPVVFVVYHLGEAVGTGTNLSDAVLQAQLARMNQVYAAQGAYAAGFNTQIQFVLAQRSPTCTAINGIIRYNASGVSGYSANGITSYGNADNLTATFPAYANSSAEQFVTIRVVTKMTGGLNGVGGFASAGGDIFVRGDNSGLGVTGLNYELLAHEMGHVLNLGHTFQGSTETSAGVYSCPANTNPSIDGDGVADTDPHKANDLTCSSSAINVCTGQPFGNLGINVMNYACDRIFTSGQTDRMQTMLAGSLINLSNSNAAIPPAANEVLTAATCTPTIATATNYWNTGISGFVFNTLNHTSSIFVIPGSQYIDYSCTNKTTVSAGSIYTVQVATEFSPNKRVYIDYNNDGAFNETNEKVFAAVASGNSTGNVTIPISPVLNTYLRVRVISDLGSNNLLTACNVPGHATYGGGEIQDYAVLIQSGACTPPAAPTLTAGPIAFCVGNGFQTSISCPAGSTAVVTSGPGAISAGMLSVTATTAGTYSISAVCSLGAGCNSAPRGFAVTITNPPTILVNSMTTTVGQSVSLNPNCSTFVNWSDGNTSLSRAVSPSATTSYTAVCTGQGGGCPTTTIFILNVQTPTPPSPTIVLSQTAVCQGTPIIATVSCPSGSFSAVLSTNITGTFAYTAVCSSGSGVTGPVGSAFYTVYPVPLPPSFPINLTVVQNGTLVLTSVSACNGTVVWTGNGSSGTGSIPVSTSAVGIVTYSASCRTANCISTAVPVSVTVVPLIISPPIVAGNTTSCAGQPLSVTLTCTTPNTTTYYTNAVPLVVSPVTTGIPGVSTLTIPAATPAGTYNFTLTCGTQTQFSQSIPLSLTIKALPTAMLTASPSGIITCNNQSVTLTASGGNFYNFSGQGLVQASISATAVVSQPGVYNVTVTGTNGCVSSTTVLVTSNKTPPAIIAFAPSGTLTCSIVAVNLSVTATGQGSLSYSFGSPGGGVTNNGTNNVAGTSTAGFYSVTVTNGANGCTASATTTVTSNTTTPIANLTPISPTLTCSNTSVTLTASGGSGLPGTGYVFAGPGLVSTSGNSTVVNRPGNYSVVVTGANGCSAVATTTVGQNTTPPTASLTATGLITCNNPTVTLLASGGINYTFAGSGVVSSSGTVAVVNQAGTYSVVVTAANGCTALASTIVTSNTAAPTINAGVSGTLTCATPSVALTASGGTVYTLSNGQSGTSGFFSISQPGAYSILATGTNGCLGSAVVVVVSNTSSPAASLTTTNPTLTCTSPTATLFASGGNTYQFIGTGVVSTSGNTAFINQAATYSVVVTGANGCTALVTTTVNSNTATPIASLSASGVLTCATTSVSLIAAGGNGYLFSGNGLSQSATTGITLVSLPGTYFVRVTGSNGCTALASTTVTSSTAAPTINPGVSGTLTCANTSVTITASGGSSLPGTGYVFAGPGFVSTSGNSAVVNQPGMYLVTITGVNGCTASATTSVSQNVAPPAASLATNGTLTCTNLTVTLTASGGSDLPGVLYRFIGPGLSQNGASPSAIVSQTGVYTVLVTGVNGCTATSSTVVTTNPNDLVQVSLSVSGTVTCAQAATLTAISNATTFVFGPGAIQIGNTNQALVGAGGTYSVTAISMGGCQNSATATILEDKAPPTPTLLASGTITCANLNATLTASNGVSYAFRGPGLNQSGATNVWLVSEPGLYSLTATAANGCTATTTATVLENRILPTATLISTSTLNCLNGDAVLIAGAGVHYFFTGPGLSQSGPGNTASAPQPGLYSVQVTGSNGCTATATTTVMSDFTPPAATLVVSGPIGCTTPIVTLTASDGSGLPATSYWFLGPGLNQSGIVRTATVSQIGTYTVIVTGANGCTASASVSVTSNQTVPEIGVSGSTTFCEGQSTQLTVTGNGSIRWSTGATTPTVSISANGIFSVTLTSSNGCVAIGSRLVTAVSCVTAAPATPTPTGCGSPTNTIGQPLVITGVTDISCVNGTFRILTTGGNGRAINFAGIIGLSNTSPFNCVREVDGVSLVAAINNPGSTIQSFTLHGSQVEGGTSTRFVFDFKQACTGTISTTTAPPSTTVAPPANPTPANCGSPTATLGGSVTITGVTDVSCATGTFRILTTGGNGQTINFALIPGLALTDPYNCVRGVDGTNTIAAINNPNSTIQPFELRGMQVKGGPSTVFMFDFKAACAGTPGSVTLVPPVVPPANPTPTGCGSSTNTIGQPLIITNVADVNCVAGTFRILTTGGNGLPINFAGIVGVNSTSPYDCVRQVESGNREAIINPNSNIQSFTLLGTQVGGGSTTPFSFNFKQFCTGVARQAQTESVPELAVTVLGNPSLNEQVIVEVREAASEPVTLRVSTVQGQPVSEQTILPVGWIVRQSVRLGQSAGVYLLRVSTPTRTKIVKVVRQ